MTFKELLNKIGGVNIIRAIQLCYPDQDPHGYVIAFYELMDAEPTESQYTIHIRHVDDTLGGIREEFEDVYLMRPNDDTHWAMDFIEWSEVLAMQIDESVFEKYSTLEIVAHLMFEITFYGFNNDKVQAKANEVLAIKEGIDNGTIQTVPFDPNMFD